MLSARHFRAGDAAAFHLAFDPPRDHPLERAGFALRQQAVLLKEVISSRGWGFNTGKHFLVHRGGAKIHAARPFDATEIWIHAHGVEHRWLLKLLENTAAPFRFDGIDALDTIVEPDFQPITFERRRFDDANHGMR